MSRHSIQLTVNGEAVSREVPGRRLLADFLRDDLHLTGTKRGCETSKTGWPSSRACRWPCSAKARN